MSEPDAVLRRRVADKLGWIVEDNREWGDARWIDGNGNKQPWFHREHTYQADTALPAWESDLSVAWEYVVPALIAREWVVTLKACDDWCELTLEHITLFPNRVDRRVDRQDDLADAARLLCEAFLVC